MSIGNKKIYTIIFLLVVTACASRKSPKILFEGFTSYSSIEQLSNVYPIKEQDTLKYGGNVSVTELLFDYSLDEGVIEIRAKYFNGSLFGIYIEPVPGEPILAKYFPEIAKGANVEISGVRKWRARNLGSGEEYIGIVDSVIYNRYLDAVD